MRAVLAVLLIVAFIAPTFGQDAKRVLAENVRSTEKIVKGAPFSAEAVAESVQILADGNRITRRNVSHLYRDSEGRFRREDMPRELGVPGAVVEMPQSISIADPVSAIKYSLNTKDRTFRQSEFRQAIDLKRREEERARRQTQDLLRQAQDQKWQEINANGQIVNPVPAKIQETIAKAQESAAKAQESIAKLKADIAKPGFEAKELAAELKASIKTDVKGENGNSDSTSKTDSLGVQNIEGVQAEGKRTTTTIPAGAIGNEMPIEVIYERWYSSELQLVVFSKHSDPRFGVQTYRLTNINRSEQPITFFSPPADYRPAEEKLPKPAAFPVNKALPAPPMIKTPAVKKAPPAEPKKEKQTVGIFLLQTYSPASSRQI